MLNTIICMSAGYVVLDKDKTLYIIIGNTRFKGIKEATQYFFSVFLLLFFICLHYIDQKATESESLIDRVVDRVETVPSTALFPMSVNTADFIIDKKCIWIHVPIGLV